MAVLHDPPGPQRARADSDDVRFHVERFQYTPADLVLRLSIGSSLDLRGRHPLLFIESDLTTYAYAPLVACARQGQPRDECRWRATFSVPVELALDSNAEFRLGVSNDLLLALPRPSVLTLCDEHLGGPGRGGGRRSSVLRRTTLLVVLGCELCVAHGWSPAKAMGDVPPTPGTGAETARETTPEPAPVRESGESPEQKGEAPPSLPGEVGRPAPETVPRAAQLEPSSTPQGPSQAVPTGPRTTQTSSTPTESPASRSAGPELVEAMGQSAQRASGSWTAPARHRPPGGSERRGEGEADTAGGKRRSAELTPAAPAVQELPSSLTGLPFGLTGIPEDAPPAYLIPIYKQAGSRYGVPWRVLAAINLIETDYGRDLSVSTAGAIGWMQFMPETWRQWSVDADHDGYADPYSPRDAIFTAARYLRASGASRDLPAAIFAYNHADWYVAEVLLGARMIGGRATLARVQGGYALPLDPLFMSPLGRTDDGVDIEAAPDGALVYSITPGIVTAVASDPAGFGPDYPVVEATSGPLRGQHVYYGHVAVSLVHTGQHVAAGQPIAIVGHSGDAASLGHGHIEIGFSDSAGDPLSHHGAEPRTPSGEVMRRFVLDLSAAFDISTG